VLLAAVLYGSYHPLGSWTATLDGASPVTAWDLALPLWPVWIYPYSWVFFLGFLPLCVVRPMPLFRRVALAYCVLELVALVCFVVVPVHMTHGPGHFAITSFATWGLAVALWVDTRANCFPSLHVAAAVLAALTTWRVDRTLGGIAAVLAALIAASTVLVKQHYLVDVIAGGGLAWICHRVLVAPVDLGAFEPSELALSRAWALVPLVAWAMVVAGLFAVYATGWSPPRG